MFSSHLRLSLGVIALHPAELPRGLRVILTPVIYGAAALHCAGSAITVLATLASYWLFVDGRSASDWHT